MSTIPSNAFDRHPWLETFVAEPVTQLSWLLAGRADIYPFARASSVDAARMLFGGLDADDPARAALSEAILGWLEQTRRAPLSSEPAILQNQIRQVVEVFEIVASLHVTEAAEGLRRRYLFWRPWAERMVLSSARDARATYLRMLANTQGLVALRFEDADGLAPLWMRICRDAGQTLPERYLQIGLVGLRKLPLAINRGDSPWIAGLAEWALVHNPSPAEFLAVWRPLKRLYPSSPSVLRKQIFSLLSQKPFKDADIEPPGWWRSDPDFPQLQHRSPVSFGPVPKEAHESLIEAIESNRPFRLIEPRLRQLMEKHRLYAERSGDADYLIKTFCNVGMKLIEHGNDARLERSRIAEMLAREALNHRPFHIYAWALWRDSLAARGEYEAARDLGWEIVRRFPNDARARNLLAELMMAGGEITDAMRVVRLTIREDVADAATYALLARFEAADDHIESARSALLDGLKIEPGNPFLEGILKGLAQGRKPQLHSSHFHLPLDRFQSESDPTREEVMRNGRLRALRDQLTESGDALSRLRSILEEDPTFAYAQILAARHRIWRIEEGILPPVAAAFEAALADEDRAVFEELAERAPRLLALIHLARALFGDEESAQYIARLLEQEDERSLVEGERIIKFRLLPVLRLVQGGTEPSEAISLHRPRVLQILYDANEALAAPELLAA